MLNFKDNFGPIRNDVNSFADLARSLSIIKFLFNKIKLKKFIKQDMLKSNSGDIMSELYCR